MKSNHSQENSSKAPSTWESAVWIITIICTLGCSIYVIDSVAGQWMNPSWASFANPHSPILLIFPVGPWVASCLLLAVLTFSGKFNRQIAICWPLLALNVASSQPTDIDFLAAAVISHERADEHRERILKNQALSAPTPLLLNALVFKGTQFSAKDYCIASAENNLAIVNRLKEINSKLATVVC